MNAIEKLTQHFKKFPGIGPRQARRFVYFLLSQSDSYVDTLLNEINILRKQTAQCPECFLYFTKDNYSQLCDICSRSDTDTSVLLIVAKDVDVEVIRRSDAYKGRYFVLGGTLPFLEKNPRDFIRSDELLSYVSRNKDQLREIIFALPITPEGDNTRVFLEELLPINRGILKTLGRGLSTGTEIEYSDSDTIVSAFKNRF